NSTFSVSTQSGVSLKTTGSRSDSIFGYASAEAPGASLNGLAILESKATRPQTVSQVGIPAPAMTTSGRLFVDVTITVRAVVSIANPSGEDATVDFFLTDSSGMG